MTMLIVFIKEHKDINLGEFSAGATAYVSRPLAQRLVGAEIAETYDSYLKKQKVKKETAELKPKLEKAIVKPVVVKPNHQTAKDRQEIIDEFAEPESGEVDDRDDLELGPDDCAGFKIDGDPCTATPTGGSKYCWRHEPK